MFANFHDNHISLSDTPEENARVSFRVKSDAVAQREIFAALAGRPPGEWAPVTTERRIADTIYKLNNKREMKDAIRITSNWGCMVRWNWVI